MKDLESKTDKRINIIKKKMRAQNEEHDTKEAERDTKEAERDTKEAERDAKDAERDAKDKERDKLIASLQRDRSKEEKRPADNQGEGTSQKKKKKAEPRFISKMPGSNRFRWEKNTKGIKHSGKDFKTVEEASKAMAVYFENEAKKDTAANDAD